MSPIYNEELKDLLTFGIAKNGTVYTWDTKKKVRAGTPLNLDKHVLSDSNYNLGEKEPEEIAGMAISKKTNYVYTWYRDNFRTYGKPTDLIANGNRVAYYLPRGYNPDDIIDMGISLTDTVYTFYKKNGECKVSVGNSTNLASESGPTSCTLPKSIIGEQRSAKDIIGVAINTNNNFHAWYKDGTMSIGTKNNLGELSSNLDLMLYQIKSANYITDLINDKISDKRSENFSLKLSEQNYLFPTNEEIVNVADQDTSRIKTFLPGTVVTDAFSYLLKSAFHEREYQENCKYPYCLGLLVLINENTQKREVYNIAISSDEDILYFDHQNNYLVKYDEYNPPFEIPDGKVQFIII